MTFSKEGEWNVSHCGNYRIQPISWAGDRANSFRLEVHLVDGWVGYPESFRLMRDAKAEARRIEED